MIDFRLYFISNRKLCLERSLARESIEDVVEMLCKSGLKAMQLREKDLSARELFEQAQRIRTITKRSGTKLFINDRIDIALGIGAEGIHAPEAGWLIAEAKNVWKQSSDSCLGKSTHSLEAALLAENDGADFVTFGPVFETPSKLSYGLPQGLEKLKEVTSRVTIPVFALGGITPERARRCREMGAHGVGVISDLILSRNRIARIKEYREALGDL